MQILGINWRPEKRKVAELKNWDKNPRIITPESLEKLKQDIINDGFHDVLLIDVDNTVISGNQRKNLLLELGVVEVWCLIPERKLTENERIKFGLQHNLHSGQFENELLRRFDIGLLKSSGFDEAVLSQLTKLNAKEQDLDEAPPVDFSSPTHSNLGDVWLLGRHRLMCGDSTKSADVVQLMGQEKANMVFTDPPYNVAYGKANNPSYVKRQILNDEMTPEKFIEFCEGFISNLLAFCNGSVYVCMSCKEWPTLQGVFERLGGHWSRTIIWVKDKLVLSRSDYHTQFEPVSVFNEEENKEGEPILYGWKDGVKRVWVGGRKQTDIWNFKRPRSSKEHPTMKPVELVIKAITNSSKTGDVVLDLFGGSGSTLIACEQTGRECRMMELDPKYCDVILNRWEKLTGQKAIKI